MLEKFYELVKKSELETIYSICIVVVLSVILAVTLQSNGQRDYSADYKDNPIFQNQLPGMITFEQKMQKIIDDKARAEEERLAREAEEQKKNENISRYSDIWFCQFDSAWTWYSYGASTIGDGGCGLCAATCIIDMLLNQHLTPPEVSDDIYSYYDGWGEYYLPGAGTIHAGLLDYVSSKGLNVWYSDIYDAIDYVRGHKSDACIYISSRGPFMTNEGYSYWTDGHIICAYFVDSDYVYVQDSARWDTCNVQYSIDEFIELSYNASAIAVVSR